MLLLIYRTPSGVLLAREEYAPTAADLARIHAVVSSAVLETCGLNKGLQETIVDGLEGRTSIHLAESTAKCLFESVNLPFPEYSPARPQDHSDISALVLR